MVLFITRAVVIAEAYFWCLYHVFRVKEHDAYIASVFGLLGGHHFYLGRTKFGLLYLCTLGLFGIGFIFDLFRMKSIVDHVNEGPDDEVLSSDVWILCLVLGPFGAHYFHRGKIIWGIFYLFTLGVFGMGWIIDVLRISIDIVSDDMESESGHKSLATAYILSIPPFGMFGLHHYYLGNKNRFYIYFLTFGLFGFGWWVDIFQMYLLVSDANKVTPNVTHIKGIVRCICMSPLGILGVHHFLMNRRMNGIFYLFTFGCLGLGWVIDWIRFSRLMERHEFEDEDVHVDDAYIYWLPPFGVFGLHHFYLGRYKWGCLYLCTLGLFGIGFIFDLFRMKSIVHRVNHGPGHAAWSSDVRLLCLVLGPFGAHYFYLGKIKFGIFYLFTLGVFGMGWIIDVLRISLSDDQLEEMTKLSNSGEKNLATAYILSIPPFGMFGLHHYYLGNKTRFYIYLFTFGIFGFGWWVDIFQMYLLVSKANEVTPDVTHVKGLVRCICMSPLGILGAHHFLMNRRMNGIFYLFTFGCLGLGWVIDWIRFSRLMERHEYKDEEVYVDDAYIYWLPPFGVLGCHHFYLGRYKWGCFHLFTFGFLLIGWVVDGFRIPCLVDD